VKGSRKAGSYAAEWVSCSSDSAALLFPTPSESMLSSQRWRYSAKQNISGPEVQPAVQNAEGAGFQGMKAFPICYNSAVSSWAGPGRKTGIRSLYRTFLAADNKIWDQVLGVKSDTTGHEQVSHAGAHSSCPASLEPF